MTLRVELLHGGGRDFAPPPGRDLVLPPGTTFDALADAINFSFARWDLGHLHSFTLADGTLVADKTFTENLITSPMSETIRRSAPPSTPVKRLVKKGDQFLFVFDFGDDWTHCCTVTGTADPYEVLGAVPEAPMAYWGWGDLPDQYGRRWAEDDGESEPPVALMHTEGPAPDGTTAPEVDLGAVRAAVAGDDSKALIGAITGCRIDEELRQVGSALETVWRNGSRTHRDRLAPYLVAVANRLTMRAAAGDRDFANQLMGVLR